MVTGAGDSNIQGFATEFSINKGQTVFFKVNTPATDYRLDVYRVGYYGGNGARQVATVQPNVTLPQTQPSCIWTRRPVWLTAVTGCFSHLEHTGKRYFRHLYSKVG